jgi:competence protein ComEA
MLKKYLCLLSLLFLAHSTFAAIDVNKADSPALQTVKGIGQRLASDILREREKGRFNDWADLIARVKGIGKRNASKLSQQGLTVNKGSFSQEPLQPKIFELKQFK